MYFDDERQRFVADWRDKKGKRHRRFFTSEKAAMAFEGQEKRNAPKNNSTSRAAARYSSRTSATAARASNSNHSSRQRVISIREGSARRISSQSKKPSKSESGRQ